MEECLQPCEAMVYGPGLTVPKAPRTIQQFLLYTLELDSKELWWIWFRETREGGRCNLLFSNRINSENRSTVPCYSQHAMCSTTTVSRSQKKQTIQLFACPWRWEPVWRTEKLWSSVMQQPCASSFPSFLVKRWSFLTGRHLQLSCVQRVWGWSPKCHTWAMTPSACTNWSSNARERTRSLTQRPQVSSVASLAAFSKTDMQLVES